MTEQMIETPEEGYTDKQLECLAMIDTLFNFTSVHNSLVRLTKKNISKAQKNEAVHNIVFISGLYEDLAHQLLDHPNVDEFMTPEQQDEIVKSLNVIVEREAD